MRNLQNTKKISGSCKSWVIAGDVRFVVWAMVATFSFAAASDFSHAQSEKSQQPPPNLEREVVSTLSNYLSFSGVSTELELTIEQQDALFGCWLEVKAKLEREFVSHHNQLGKNTPDAVREEMQQELREAIRLVRDAELERLQQLLDSGQIKRLRQLRAQFLWQQGRGEGVMMLVEELKLSAAQTKEFFELDQPFRESMLEIQTQQKEIGLSRLEVLDLVDEANLQARKRMEKILTAGQLKKLESLSGPPFDFRAGSNRVDQKNEPSR